MKKFVLTLLFIFLGVQFLAAQGNEQIITVKLLSSVDKLLPGNSYRIALKADIKEPFHINSNTPSEDFLIPTTVTLKAPEGVTIGKLIYPKAEIKKFDFSEKPLAVYENTVYIFTTMSISSDYPGKEIRLKGSFGYQACNNQSCLAPADLVFSRVLPVAKAGETVTPVNQDIFARQALATTGEQTALSGEDSFAKTVAEKGLFLTFLLVFIGGLALNLTPCVYPLIPITISYFGGQAEGKKGSLVTHAFIYVFGMAITYSVLGVIAALSGSLFGSALQNPYVLVGIAVVLVGLSLSMFDLYEIRVPAFLSNFAGGAKQGFFGSFFMGLTVGIVAAPCIGPFVLALLTYVGERGSVVLGFWLFFVLALGLGVPFLFLGIFSGSINKLPRSGAWMVWVRSIFGFILIAMAVYFLAPLFPNTLLYHLTLVLIMLIGGIYMAWLEPTPSQGKAFPVVRNLIGILFFALALYFASTGIQGYLDDRLSQVRLQAGTTAAAEEIHWSAFSDEKLQEAQQQGKPVMIDFYADWCIPCKELDKFTFSQKEVVELARNFIMLKVDLTKGNHPEVKALKKRFNIKGVPTLVFLQPDGSELKELRVVGFMEKKEFLTIMQKAVPLND